MSVLSVRGVPEDVARGLKRLAGERGESVESLVRSALIALVRPLNDGEAAFWGRVRETLKPGDVEALTEACGRLDDAAYEPKNIG